MELDALQYAKDGTLAEVVAKVFGDECTVKKENLRRNEAGDI